MRLFTLTRLVTAEGRGAAGRLVGMAGGIAVGVALLLLLLGAYGGITSRSERLSWPDLHHGELTQVPDPAAAAPTAGSVLAATSLEHFDGREIVRVDIVATPDSTVVVPGVGQPPAAGTYHASPALTALIEANPTDILGSRYGTRAGSIDEAGLAGPDSLVVVTGTTTENLRSSGYGRAGSVLLGGGAWSVTEFRGVSYPSSNYRTITIIGAIAILLPVLILVGIVTRLGAATRAERFAALRLIGATPRRVAAIAATETGVTSLVGALAGVALAWLLIPVAALVEIDDGRLFRTDLTVPPSTVLIVVASVVAGCTAVAGWRTSRARIGPLGGSRERTERRPTALGIVPLIAGVVVLLGATTAALRHTPLPHTDRILIAGFVLLLVGLMAAGPVLTYWIARIAARGAHRTAGVIAMNRIQQHPRATFRAVSGLVAAIFLVSVFSAGITTVAEESLTEDSAHLSPTTLIASLSSPPDDASAAASGITAVTAAASRIARTDGVTATAIGYSHPESGSVFTAADAALVGLPTPEGASHIQVTGGFFGDGPLVTRPAATPDPRPGILVVATDGTTHSVERARTAILGSKLDLSSPPRTQADHESARLHTWADRYANLGHLGVLVATLISAVSLAVSSIAAILDRKRVLGLLRLMGMPASTVRRVIVAEAALPLATVFALCVGLGILTAWCLIAGLTEGRRTITWLPPSYYLILATSLALAATAVISTFRTARTSTTIEATRIG
ncbi:ABC transporter permease [Salinispora mooreana]|uniref:ABC transporter permease n=1 Tax=Salinispora mooreana TaxID=999545 RepID=UPI0003683D59|nr:ABC transporter permease [Salinispora mooreana]